MTKKKKILAIVLAVVILCGAGVGIGFGIYNSRPENVAIQSIANTITEFGEREEIYPIASMLKQGSLEASMTKLKSDGESLIGNASVSGKFYFSPDAFAAEDIKFKYNDIKINADAYISRDIIYVSENEILDGEYGIDLSNPSKLAEKLEDSIFAPGSKSGYEIPEEIFDPIIEILENLDPDAIEKDFNRISETYVKQLWKIICEHAEFEAERDNVRVGGEKINARIVTITITSDALYDIISDFYDFMLDDELIIDFLDTHCEGIESAFEDTQGKPFKAQISFS